MTRWPRLWELLTGEPYRSPEERRRDALRAKLIDAESRGDCRDQGRTAMELRQATTEALAASLASQHPTQARGSR
jgi:hypothetical protein